MFLSIDSDGKVLINTVQKVMFIFKASKHILVDPQKMSVRLFACASARFE